MTRKPKVKTMPPAIREKAIRRWIQGVRAKVIAAEFHTTEGAITTMIRVYRKKMEAAGRPVPGLRHTPKPAPAILSPADLVPLRWPWVAAHDRPTGFLLTETAIAQLYAGRKYGLPAEGWAANAKTA